MRAGRAGHTAPGGGPPAGCPALLAVRSVRRARDRRIEKMHLLTLALVVVFGGATLWLQDLGEKVFYGG